MSEEFNEKLMEEIRSIKEIVNDTNTKIGTITTQIQDLEQENKKLKQAVKSLEDENFQLSKTVYQLEQYSYKGNLIINGVPYRDDENVRELVSMLAQKLNINVRDYDICAAHRLPTNKGRIPSIVVKLNNHELKSIMITNAKRQKLHGNSMGFDPALPIYINEHHTKKTREFINLAKKLQSEGKIAYTWVRDGKVFVKVTENSPRFLITDLSELTNIAQLDLPNESDKEELQSEDSEEPGNDGESQGNSKRTAAPKTKRELRPKSNQRQLTIDQLTINAKKPTKTTKKK